MSEEMRKVALSVALLLTAALLTAGDSEEVFEKAFSMEGVLRVGVENFNGRVEALAWDKPYLKVQATKKASGSRAEETLHETEVRVRKIGNEIRIETVNPNRHRLFGFLDFGIRNARVDYKVLFPAGAELRLETCNGEVQASGTTSPLSCDTVNGAIELAEIAGPVKATTVNGSLRIGFRGPLQNSRLETVNGSIEVAFDRKSSVAYDLSTVNGRIEGDFELASAGKHGAKTARGEYNGGSSSLKCETVNGSIRLRANPETAAARPN
jgi:DUF4097 and DUF4098 domain-containing protein YvlB